jgi:hypothetical protein
MAVIGIDDYSLILPIIANNIAGTAIKAEATAIAELSVNLLYSHPMSSCTPAEEN